jgi:hypothetical protein
MSGSPTSIARIRNFAWPLASFAVLVAMTAVLSSHVAGKLEVAVRHFASALGLAAVPVLLVLAFRTWMTKQSGQLSPWRSGLGLSSIVVLSAVWLLYWGMRLVASMGALSHSFRGLEWLSLVLYSSLLAFVLAFALRGAARSQAISAALLMWASIQAGIYI